MEIYNLPEYGSAETYLDTGLNIHHSSSSLGQLEAMYADGTPEYVVEQGLYYPTAPNFGYICTGYEPPSDWDGHNNIFGVDSQEVQYAGSLVENFPYAYFAPSYGYTQSPTQSPYNPYNPYIPGAMMRVDGSITGSQQFYTLPSYEQQNSSPSYFPMVAQSGPDIICGGATDLFFDTHAFTASRSDVPGVRNTLSSTSANSTGISTKPASDQTRSFVSAASGPKTNAGPSKLPAAHGTITSSALSSVVPSHEQQPGWSVGAVDDTLHGKALSHRNHVKASSNIDSSDDGPVSSEKTISKFQHGRSSDGLNGICSDYGSSYQGGKPKSHLAVEAYTNRRGGGDSDGKENIINKDEEFRLEHVNAKFFVIKSYSEDDVHKSIKYNVWSSTPNGNKKLHSAYEDAQRVCDGCPIFLFFSVNASGQFCGVAEMIGAVDFSKDMDFWQQDKWSGSFPVKWHFIKDVPNPCFRHIILENNENKPVTNSRDTQEIRYKQGIEMLEIFKSYSVKTCLLDDFIYYENRQRMMQDEKARLLRVVKRRSCYGTSVVDSSVAGQILPSPDSDTTNATRLKNKIIEAQNDEEGVASLKIGSLTINDGKQQQQQFDDDDNIVTVGSMPVVVMVNKSSPGFFTVGSINLDPKTNESPPLPSA